MKAKRGASQLVVVAILIIVVLAAVFLIARFLLPFVSNSLNSAPVEMNVDIKNVEAYYNNEPIASQITPSPTQETVYVRVERSGGSSDANLTGLKFVFTVNGETQSCIRKSVPTNLESYVYSFKSSLFKNAPNSIEVIPLGMVNGKERQATITFKVNAFNSTKTFEEKVNECGGFCCNSDNPNLPSDQVPSPKRT